MFMLSTKAEGRVAQFEVRDDQHTYWHFHLEASERLLDARADAIFGKDPQGLTSPNSHKKGENLDRQ